MDKNRKPSLLAIDDTPMSLALLAAVLKDEFDFTSVTSAEEALTLLAEKSFDLILLDIVMPGMDGFEAFAEIRKLPGSESTPIIFLTASEDHTSEKRGLALGAADFIFKPIRVDLVRLRIRNTLRLRRMAAELQASEERLRYVMEATGEGVWDWDIASGTVVHNRGWCSLLGLDESALEHPLQFFADLIHPEDFGTVQNSLYECLEGKSAYHSEHRLRRSDGEYIWVEDIGHVVRHSQNGRPLRMVGSIKDVSRRKADEARIHQLAFYDTLTGLPNRRLFFDRLQQAIERVRRSRSGGALMFIDMDRFKELNDTHGHAAGDALLIEVARRLEGAVRRQDTVARLGGDEFVVLLEGLPADMSAAQERAALVGEKLLQALNVPYPLRALEYRSTPSIGLAVFDAAVQSSDEIVARADRAMYVAKAEGRNRLCCAPLPGI
jgi:diguanylate cyclase (GGDEF)-like protein/PAS domain S-box-containing protein